MATLNERCLLPSSFPKHFKGFDIRDLTVQPWQNGRGATREIARGSMCVLPNAEHPAWDWRISLADLTSPAAFSTFEGVDRVAILAGHSPVVLEGASTTIAFEQQGDIRAFAGEQLLEAELPGILPTQLLNLMTRRGTAQAAVEVTTTGWTHRTVQSTGLLIVLRGIFAIDGSDTHDRHLPGIQLGPGQGMHWEESPASIQATPCGPDACLACIQIQSAISALEP